MEVEEMKKEEMEVEEMEEEEMEGEEMEGEEMENAIRCKQRCTYMKTTHLYIANKVTLRNEHQNHM